MKTALILVVDDNQWFLQYAQKVLERSGFTVETASHGFAAIDRLDEIRADALLLDIFLPGSNGIALLHELRSHKDFADLPVVTLTSVAETTAENLAPYGVAAHLDKTTMTPQTLVAAARKAVRHAR